MSAPTYTDDAVRERHGCACRTEHESGSFVNIWEGESFVYVDADRNTRKLTPWQARYLAAKLYRLSRRIRIRAETGSTS